MNRWSGRVALVTGASSGIGAAISKELVNYGMKVIGCSRKIENIEAIANEAKVGSAPGNLHAIRCDMRKESDIASMFDEIRNKFGKIDVCVNNAGLGHKVPLLDGGFGQWKEMFEVNVMGLCLCTREAVKLMTESRIPEGLIVNMNSIGAHMLPSSPDQAGFNFYRSTKTMVRFVTEGLRQELKAIETPIRVASISAGVVETDFFNKNMGPEKAKELYAVMGSLKTEDLVKAMVYILASPPDVEVCDIIVEPVTKIPSILSQKLVPEM